MKTILEKYLDSLDIDYTKHFVKSLYQEHPHKYNMFGLKKMLDVYGVKTIGVYVVNKDLSKLSYPCILHIHGDFVIGQTYDADTVTFLLHDKKTTLTHDSFKRMWTGNALVVQETTDAVEPDYKKHQRDELISMSETYCIPVMLILAVFVGLANNSGNLCIYDMLRMILNSLGVLACVMLLEKQLYGESHYGDRVCSMFHHADCNTVLDGPMAKVFGISWSEIGLGYFIANMLLLSLFPVSNSIVAIINWIAMLYGVWSIYYQWRVAKSWCVLCIMVQVLIWMIGMTTFISYLTISFNCSIVNNMFCCMFFIFCIMAIHFYASACLTEKKYVHAIQQYRAIKADRDVAKTIIEKSIYYKTTYSDSSIIFGNPQAKTCVTILSNPHCNPCARMHERVERILETDKNKICIQYIFSSFNKDLEISNRYLIYCYYKAANERERRTMFSNWYAYQKYHYEEIIKKNSEHLYSERINKEMEHHANWMKRTGLVATPTIIVNGYLLPTNYSIEDLLMVLDYDS